MGRRTDKVNKEMKRKIQELVFFMKENSIDYTEIKLDSDRNNNIDYCNVLYSEKGEVQLEYMYVYKNTDIRENEKPLIEAENSSNNLEDYTKKEEDRNSLTNPNNSNTEDNVNSIEGSPLSEEVSTEAEMDSNNEEVEVNDIEEIEDEVYQECVESKDNKINDKNDDGEANIIDGQFSMLGDLEYQIDDENGHQENKDIGEENNILEKENMFKDYDIDFTVTQEELMNSEAAITTEDYPPKNNVDIIKDNLIDESKESHKEESVTETKTQESYEEESVVETEAKEKNEASKQKYINFKEEKIFQKRIIQQILKRKKEKKQD